MCDCRLVDKTCVTHNQDSQVNINHKHPLIQTFKETHGLAI